MTGNTDPLVSLILIAYNQQQYVREAVRGALAQTWSPLEIIISDDCSSDATYDAIVDEVQAYTGPHRVILNRNKKNLGISGHLGSLWPRVSGELVVIAAGDDISVPERCEKIVDFWLAHECKPDLIASDLVMMRLDSSLGKRITLADLDAYHDINMWLERPVRYIGAAHAWSRRLMQAFPPLPVGAWEDQIMVFRAILLGGAVNLHEPLVQYRNGGLSQPARALSAQTVADRLLAHSKRTLIATQQMTRDTRSVPAGRLHSRKFEEQRTREQFIHAVLSTGGWWEKLRLCCSSFNTPVPFSLRVRICIYANFTLLLAPLFFLKRILCVGS